MSLEPLFEEDFWEVHIQWTRPRAYERVRDDGSEHNDSACLYYICAQFSTSTPKVLYIGQTYWQSVSVRLQQPDHKHRYAAFVRNYPKHRFYVSHGVVSVTEGRLTKRRVDDVEWLLIYANKPEHAHNVKNIYDHGVASGSYFITNAGYRSGLPRSLRLGVFIEYTAYAPLQLPGAPDAQRSATTGGTSMPTFKRSLRTRRYQENGGRMSVSINPERILLIGG